MLIWRPPSPPGGAQPWGISRIRAPPGAGGIAPGYIRKLALYPITIFLSAFLLFVVQPVAGRLLLPTFGGSPAVWTTCLFFFQGMLLLGYAYAHWIARTQKLWVHVLVMMLPLLEPIAYFGIDYRPASPTGRILWTLLLFCGPHTFLLCSTSPLLQHRYGVLTGKTPYRLYALSNAGSLLGLLSYPFLIEPWFRLTYQTIAFFVIFVVFLTCYLLATRDQIPALPEEKWSVDGWSVGLWIGLSALGSLLLAGTTNQMTQEVTVTPFLWILPLAVYLVAFILTFESEKEVNSQLYGGLASLAVMGAMVVQSLGISVPLWVRTLVYVMALFTGCMVAFGELARRKPPAREATAFYLAIALGGVVGTAFATFAAPRLFKSYLEFPLALIGCLLVRFIGWRRDGSFAIARYAVPLLSIGAAGVLINRDLSSDALVRKRNFFGIVSVDVDRDQVGVRRQLTHGTIVHGVQYFEPDKLLWPTSYYGPGSGVGLVLKRWADRPLRVGAIGLGTGTVAAWGKEPDVYRFFEINPDVVDIAQHSFSYLRRSPPRVEIVLGDARLTLQEDKDRFDILIVDAFSSDAIPAHLLTQECGAIYRAKLRENGAILMHISNRGVDLVPVTRGLARDLRLEIRRLVSRGDRAKGTFGATWVLLTNNPELLGDPTIQAAMKEFTATEAAPILWTDDFHSLWPILKL